MFKVPAGFSKAVMLQPGSVKALTNRGFTKIILGDPEGALADCNRALALAPRIWEGFVGARLGPDQDGKPVGRLCRFKKCLE